MALVAPGVVRYTLNGFYLERDVANVIDMVVNDNDDLETRQTAIDAAGESILDNWVDNIMPNLSNQYSLRSITYVDLNTEDGATGEILSGGDEDLPQSGGLGGEPYTGSVAILVTKVTNGGRGSRSGRLFIPGLTEAYVNGNLIDAQYVTDMNAGLSTFIEGITETANLATVQYFPTVVHTRTVGDPPEIEYVNNTQVTSFIAQRRLASQRRRNRR